MELYNRTIKNIEDKRANLINGGINSIPSPFIRFNNDFVGVEQRTYFCITSTTKGGKSQFGSYTFIFEPLLYAYKHPEKVSYKVFYFILEETPERVLQRFMSYILYYLSNGNIRVSPRDLRSTKNNKPLSEEIITILKSEEYKKIFEFFESSIIFSTTANPTGIYKECKKYAEDHGTIVTKKIEYKGEAGEILESNIFDHYIPNNPKEYKIIFIDHIGLIDTEKGMTLKQSMDKLSEYLAKYLRNRYDFSPVVIQQQSFEGESTDSFINGRIRPSAQGLGDSKYIARDCDVLIGLFSPFKYELKEYLGYDITKFRDNIRFMELLLSRDGEMGGICPLFFDGASCIFKELPKPQDKEAIIPIYKYLDTLHNQVTQKSFFMYHIKKVLHIKTK